MKKVLICSPPTGDFFEDLAAADSLCKYAVNQGYEPLVSPATSSIWITAGAIQRQRAHQCDEVWLHCPQKPDPEMLSDLKSAVKAGKPVKLVYEIPQVEPPAEDEDPYFAADSYADAPDLDGGEGQPETNDEQSENPSLEIIAEAFGVDSLLLALRELDDIMGGALPYEWWEFVSRARGDHLTRLGVEGLIEALDGLVEREMLPPWPKDWKDELEIQFGERDWLAELPDLDRDNLDKIGDSHWHKLGRHFFLAGEYRRALDFLGEAVTENPHNYLAWSDIGHCVMNLSDLDLAIEAFELSLMLAPANFYAWVGLGQALLAGRRYSEAVSAFDQALLCKEDGLDSQVADLRAEAFRGLKQAASNAAI